MVYPLIVITRDYAAAAFPDLACTDRTHAAGGHRRCKYPRKLVVCKEEDGEGALALVHAKREAELGFRKMSEEMFRDFAKAAGIHAGVRAEAECGVGGLVQRVKEMGLEEPSVSEKGSESSEQLAGEDWEMVGTSDCEEYVFV